LGVRGVMESLKVLTPKISRAVGVGW